jgi:glycyl-tRNA synthetase beta chain
MKKSANKRPAAGRSSCQQFPPAETAAELLLEIGTEELPYQFIPPALQALKDSAERLLKEQRLACGAIRTLGTPRRLVLVVDSLAARQSAAVKETVGPSKAAAFDPAGQPTKAALGFAASQGISVQDLQIRQTPKGDYVFAVKEEQGLPTHRVLTEHLPRLIGGLSFPKSMRWNDTGIRFARPIRWLVALYGGRVLPIEVGGIRASNRSFGHRVATKGTGLSSQWFRVRDFTQYLKDVERHGVIVDQDRRRRMIVEQLAELAKAAKGRLPRDEELLEQAVYTVEWPNTILGGFKPQYLSLPKEILMTAMKEHQGYFSLVDRKGALLPKFLAVTNLKLPNMDLIREGNERVLSARLADAKFFFDEDRKVRLADRVDKLKTVTFHQKIGTLYQKTARMVRLAETLAELLDRRELIRECRRAAELSKADLLTGIVGEFPTLQGVMGGEYARHDGETEAVSRAIREQYLPRSMEGDLPETLVGKILSLTDRLDTIAAFFWVGIIPTGSEDPFALRRHATAVVRLLLEGNLRLNLAEAIGQATAIVAADGFTSGGSEHDVRQRIIEFIFERVRHYGRTVHGLRDDVMDAALKPAETGPFDLLDVLAKMRALQAITDRLEFDPLMVGFKRAHRLVEKERWDRKPVDPTLFQHPAESQLHGVVADAAHRLPSLLKDGRYAETLDVLVRLKPAIDEFFAGVMVNAEDPAVRGNRLSLLLEVDRLFASVADFSLIMVQGR